MLLGSVNRGGVLIKSFVAGMGLPSGGEKDTQCGLKTKQVYRLADCHSHALLIWLKLTISTPKFAA